MAHAEPLEEPDRRRRRAFFVLLAAAVALMLLGILGGWLMLDGREGLARPSVAAPSSAPSPTVVLPPGQSVTASSSGSSTNGSSTSSGVTSQGAALRLSGRVIGQVGPGTAAQLVVTVTNPSNDSLQLTSVRGVIIKVTGSTQAGKVLCSRDWYHVGPFSGAPTVAARGSVTVELPITFDNLAGVNQDNCKGAPFTFSVTAQARSAT